MTSTLRRLRRDRSGLALLEFAFSLPLVLGIGLFGVETANLALANLRISQIALNLADNASRVGLMSSLATEQVREVDMNDVLTAAKMQGQAWDLTTRGRITISSLEADSSGNQIIHWQRCIGTRGDKAKNDSTFYTSGSGKTVTWDSNYGTTTATAGTDTTSANKGSAPNNGNSGMGDSTAPVMAPNNSGVMFIEVNYEYKPVVPINAIQYFTPASAHLHYVASFIVRDRRDFAQIYNPSPAATRFTCDKHTS